MNRLRLQSFSVTSLLLILFCCFRLLKIRSADQNVIQTFLVR
jgi:hypothetical protein